MKRVLQNLVLLGTASLFLIACSGNDEPTKEEKMDSGDHMMDQHEKMMDVEKGVMMQDSAELMSMIDKKRMDIEAMIKDIKPIEITNKEMRPKSAQKWSKVHVYAKDGKVIRIKTYPHLGVSKRTEEFYFDNGKLILATIEDDGMGKPGKDKMKIDKLYYFDEDKCIAEMHNTNEREYGTKTSESEELMHEAQEYMDIHHMKMNK